MNKMTIIFFSILCLVSCFPAGNRAKECDKEQTALAGKLFYPPDSTYSVAVPEVLSADTLRSNEFQAFRNENLLITIVRTKTGQTVDDILNPLLPAGLEESSAPQINWKLYTDSVGGQTAFVEQYDQEMAGVLVHHRNIRIESNKRLYHIAVTTPVARLKKEMETIDCFIRSFKLKQQMNTLPDSMEIK